MGRPLNQVEQLFVRGKHWHVFVYFLAVNVVAGAAGAAAKRIGGMGDGLGGMIATAIIFVGLGVWAWVVGRFLHGAAPARIRLRLRWFERTVIFPCVYFPLFGSASVYEGLGPKLFPLIFPFYLFAVYCLFYQVYFVAKSLVLAETGAETRLSEYAVVYVLTLIFPVGVWVLQPRVNRLYERKSTA